MIKTLVCLLILSALPVLAFGATCNTNDPDCTGNCCDWATIEEMTGDRRAFVNHCFMFDDRCFLDCPVTCVTCPIRYICASGSYPYSRCIKTQNIANRGNGTPCDQASLQSEMFLPCQDLCGNCNPCASPACDNDIVNERCHELCNQNEQN